jgi:hypothetical protein
MEDGTTSMSEDDWTPVARSADDPVAVVVVPDQCFELDDLRELTRVLGEAGLPVVVAESPGQRRVIPVDAVVPIAIHVSPVLKELFIGVAGTAAWDGIKGAFGRLRRRQAESPELTIDVQIESGRLSASARGPATEALAEVARRFVEQAGQADTPADQLPENTNAPQQSGLA